MKKNEVKKMHGSKSHLAIPKEKTPAVVLPASLAIIVEQDFKAGAFKFFGDELKNQQKAKEGVLWLLSTIYNRALRNGEGLNKYIPLPAKAMEQRFGVCKSSSARKVCWASIKKFCLSSKQAYIQDDGFYKPGSKATCYRLNTDKITGKGVCYYQFQEKLIINKIIRESARGAVSRASLDHSLEWKVNSNRKLSEGITRENQFKLAIDVDALEITCGEMFNISVVEFLEWVEQIKCNPGIYYTINFTVVDDSVHLSFAQLNAEQENKSDAEELCVQPNSQFTYCGKGVRRTWGTLYTHHRVHTLLSTELKGSRESNFLLKHNTPKVYSGMKYSENVENEIARKQQLVRSLMQLLLGAAESNVFTDNKGGRLYNSISSLKTEVRKTLRFRNDLEQLEKLICFDVKTCQPWLLGVVILRDYLSREVLPPHDIYDFLELIETQDLYNTIKEYSEQNLVRDAVKKRVMQDVYRSKYIDRGCKIVSDKPLTIAGDFIAKRFPNVWQWVIDNKGDGAKSLIPMLLQRLEADYFVDVVIPELTNRGIWCLTIHDAVLVREQDAEFVEQYLRESMKRFFGRSAIVAKEVYGAAVGYAAA